MGKIKISITVPKADVEQVDKIAELRRRSRSFIIAEAVEEYLRRLKTQPRKKATP